MSEAATEEDYDVLRQERDGDVRAGLAILAQCMKAQAFSGESEVRTVATVLFDAHCNFRATPFGAVRYVNLVASPKGETYSRVSVDDRSPLPIAGVRLGPCQVAQNSRAATKSALARSGYKVAIEASTASIR
jgi:hypothetical protein